MSYCALLALDADPPPRYLHVRGAGRWRDIMGADPTWEPVKEKK